MSNEKREAAQNTEYYLREAETSIRRAERSSQLTGDKSLIQKVTKVREGVSETRREIIKKLDNHSG